jgi:hypothetical protein
VRALYRALGTAAGITILAACTGGQSGIEPPATVDTTVQSTRVLQFRVGTARYNGFVYFNTLTTFRQPNGFSGTLFNTPTITGPGPFSVSSFGQSTVTAANAGVDLSSNHISGTPPTQPGTAAVPSTFNQVGGVFAYGIAPANSNTAGQANYPNNTGVASGFNAGCGPCVAIGPFGVLFEEYSQPLYLGSSRRLPMLLGPPATPNIHDGTYPSAFLGYDSGFMSFGVAPVAGTYSLHIVVPSATLGVNLAVFDQTATLTSTVGLGAQLPPVPAFPTVGGVTTGQVNVTVPPAGAGSTNQVLYMLDIDANNTPTFYSASIPAAGGTFVLTPTSGPRLPSGAGGPPVHSGDLFYAWSVGANWDIVASAVPMNLAQSPALPAQADVTIAASAGPIPGTNGGYGVP